MLNMNRRLFSNLNQFNLYKKTFRNFSEVCDKIVKFSSNLKNKEMKVPFDGSCYSILFLEGDKLSDLTNRINGSSEKLQKVEFLNFAEETLLEENKLFKDIIASPFRLRINGHHLVRYLPSMTIALNENRNLSDSDLTDTNFLLLQTSASLLDGGSLDIQKSLHDKKNSINAKIDKILLQYEKLQLEYQKAEEFIDKRLKSRRKTFANLALIFFILHAIAFYCLIYQMYGWDTVEPVTYIVGNVYWIIALSFFVMKKKKLDFGFIFAESYKKEFFAKMSQKINFSSTENLFIQKEIQDLRKFKEIVSKI